MIFFLKWIATYLFRLSLRQYHCKYLTISDKHYCIIYKGFCLDYQELQKCYLDSPYDIGYNAIISAPHVHFQVNIVPIIISWCKHSLPLFILFCHLLGIGSCNTIFTSRRASVRYRKWHWFLFSLSMCARWIKRYGSCKRAHQGLLDILPNRVFVSCVNMRTCCEHIRN